MVYDYNSVDQPYNSQRVDVNLYVATGNPFVLNDLEKEQMLKDRRTVYDTLVSQGDDDDDNVDDDDDNVDDDDDNVDDDDDDNVDVVDDDDDNYDDDDDEA
jgi:hypothetical protein